MPSDSTITYRGKCNKIHSANRRFKNGTFRHAVKRVSLASKRKIWDTNDASIAVTQSALSKWEKTYTTLRTLVVQTSSSAKMLYSTAKSGANSIEHHLLVPVRDMLLLPAFSTAEQVASSALGFISSEDARHLAQNGMQVVRHTPLVGESILIPVILKSTDILKHAWQIAQYPIPSRKYVADTTDHFMTSTKKALVSTWREFYFYAQLLDANITRTLMHTQWRILGSGPYVTLDDINKQELINHLCERYMSHGNSVSRYELAKHIQFQNPHLYLDLVVSGVLYERGGNLTKEDEWLLPSPKYRKMESIMFLDNTTSNELNEDRNKNFFVASMWFFTPNVNGESSKKDSAWVKFDDVDQLNLEQRFTSWYNNHTCDLYNAKLISSRHDNQHKKTCKICETKKINSCHDEFFSEDLKHDVDVSYEHKKQSLHTSFDNFTKLPTPKFRKDERSANRKCYPTIAKWYEPTNDDVLVDQYRHAITFFPNCSFCDKMLSPQMHKAEHFPYHHHVPFEAQECKCNDKIPLRSNFPFVKILKRPTLWRFHGQGDNVRRGSWLLHTKRNGLQPYGDASAAILEDAYLFLKHSVHFSGRKTKVEKDYQGSDVDEVLLTVQVLSPDDDENQLVQFRSLKKITAVQKTLGAAISIFKRRVYRGVCWPKIGNIEEDGAENGKASCDSTIMEKKVAKSDVKNNSKPFSDIQVPVDCLLAAPFDRVTKNKTFQSNTKSDDKIDHLVLVVHGIGEMLRSIDFFGLAQLTTIVDCCAQLRQNHFRVLEAQYDSEMKENEKNKSKLEKSAYRRVEFVPIEWHEAFAIQSRRNHQAHDHASNMANMNNNGGHSIKYDDLRSHSSPMQSNINDISLKTIPHLRSFANDTLLDVLYFMSPQYHDILIDIVTFEMNLIVDKYRRLTCYDGKVSIMAHSLGSVITWDILSHQKSMTFPSLDHFSDASSFMDELSAPEISNPPNFSHLNTQNNFSYPQLSFPVTNTFMLGSPVAVFLLIRNQNDPLPVNYVLPGCKRLFNIFHPYDPAAYRIEPLINSRNASCEAKLISHWKGGFRVQYQTKMLWRKLMKETFKTKQQMLQAVEDGMAGMGLLDAAMDDLLEDEDVDDEYSLSVIDQFSFLNNIMDDSIKLQRVECGNINQGRRIDYMLQEKEIENANEYVFALGAHSAYWDEKDLSLFIAREILRNQREDEEDTLKFKGFQKS